MRWIIYMLFILLAAGSAGCGSQVQTESPEAVDGTLSMPDDSTKDMVYTLDGEWAFYWQEFAGPASLSGTGLTPQYVETPGAWSDIKSEIGPLPDEGYGTYHLEIDLPENMQNDTAGLYIPEIATAYTLWINGEVVAGIGEPGTNQAAMEPEHHPQIAYFQPQSNTIDLVLHVSEFYQRKSGWWDSFYIGKAEEIQQMRDQNVAGEVFLVVSLLVMGLYHLGIFILRPQDLAPLYFGGVCLAVAARTLLLGEVLFLRFFSGVPWEWTLKLEYWSSCAAISCFLLFIYTQYRHDMNRYIRNGFLTLFSLLALFILVTPADIYTEGMIVLQAGSILALLYLIFVLGTALRRKRRGARAHTAAMLILLAFVLNDVLHYNHLINTGETVSIGMFFYLFAQSFILSSRFTRALNQSRKLSRQLERTNQTLEEQVKQRTRKLSETNQELEDANHSLERMHHARQELMSNISHELGTPLTSIQGYIKGMMDGVVDRNNPKYLELVYNKTIFLQKIIDDLRELAKLESGRITYEFEQRDILEYVQTLFFMYKEEIETKDISFTLEDGLSPEKLPVFVFMDPVRVEQVVSNLLLNAKKFTPPKGDISLALREDSELEKSFVTIAVRDNGAGIDQHELPNVFKRFFKGKTNKIQGQEGVGLGLAIAAEIVHAHGGEMGVDSRKGEGSVFYFTLPVLDNGNIEDKS
ncbi:ATP-binding protein [Salibacterium sp. K-3]